MRTTLTLTAIQSLSMAAYAVVVVLVLAMTILCISVSRIAKQHYIITTLLPRYTMYYNTYIDRKYMAEIAKIH